VKTELISRATIYIKVYLTTQVFDLGVVQMMMDFCVVTPCERKFSIFRETGCVSVQ
jgi:hypothetical protein